MAEPLSTRLTRHSSGNSQHLSRQQMRVYGEEAAQLEHTIVGMVGERRAAEARTASLKVTSEPLTYSRGNGHSMLLDMARQKFGRGDADGGVKAAKDRLERHRKEVIATQPRRDADREARALAETEQAITRSGAEIRALDRFTGQGARIFERRALTRTDGQGGYFVPPLWATEQYVPYALAGRPFLNLWTQLPLPGFTDSINLPRVTLGLGAGSQSSDIAAYTNRDLTDAASSALVRTVGGFVDLPMVWLDQRPADADAILIPQLIADYNTQLDGLALLGSTSAGQPAGIMPAGSTGAANLINLQLTNNGSSQAWAYGGSSIAGSPHYASAQLLSKIGTYRAQRPTGWVVNDIVWSLICAAADQQSMPLVPPGPPGMLGGYGHSQIAGHIHGLPVTIDPQMPVTFAASGTQPYIGAVTAGQTAATAGSGTYTPVLCGKWDDCFVWESDPQILIAREDLAGTVSARVRMHNYVALMPGRFVWGGTTATFSGTNQGGGVNNGAAVSYGALTQFVTNSVLQSGTGF